MRPHSEEIIKKASQLKKNPDLIKDNKIDIAVDFDDETGTTHTYVVTFQRKNTDEWTFIELSELSSL